MKNVDWAALSASVANLCTRLSAAAGPAVISRELAQIAPELSFKEVLSRGGWYRLGGVVDAAGDRVAGDLEAWAENELSARGDDMEALVDAYADRGLRATRLTGRTHVAFQAKSREQVKAFHTAALAAGGRDNGAPGERPYHPGYYAAFIIDPDGNNLEAVFHGPAERSAASVKITFKA